MKKILAVLMVWVSIVGAVTDVAAQRPTMGVQVRPQVPAYRRPPMPARGYIWVAESWRWRHNRYAFVPGQWVLPPSRNARYVPGRWDRNRYGWVWIDGYWAGRNDNRGYDDRSRQRNDDRYYYDDDSYRYYDNRTENVRRRY